jgi:peptidoglycan/LPS O-acetylase OafA/YrhL
MKPVLSGIHRHPGYRADIDGLRALAVSAVVAYHAFPSRLSGGFLGVDVFFVISGYLITGLVCSGVDAGRFNFADFYSRRIRRIVPALLVVLICCFACGWALLLADEFRALGKHVVAGSLFVSNFVLWQETGYFDVSAETKPLLHLWSLGVEEQFYLFWPLVVWVWRSSKRAFTVVTWVLFSGSLVFFLKESGADAALVFYSPLTRLWELLVGALLFRALTSGPVPSWLSSVQGSNLLAALGLSLILGSFFLPSPPQDFPAWYALPATVGTAMVILAGPSTMLNVHLLSSRLAVSIGLISYPLYLWHWPLLSFARIIEGGTPDVLVRVVAVMLAVVLAWTTYRLLETRVRAAEGSRYVAVLLSALLSCAMAGAAVHSADGVPSRAAVAGSSLTPQGRDQFVGALWKYTQNDSCLERFRFQDAKALKWWFCEVSSSSEPTVVILGTSYANQLYPGFVGNPALRHHSVLSIGTCDFGDPAATGVGRDHPCYGERGAAQAEFIDRLVRTQTSVRFVVIDGLRRDPSPTYIERLRSRIARYQEWGVQVILFTPHIKPPFHPKACFSRPLKSARDCRFPPEERQRLFDRFRPLVVALRTSVPDVKIFEQNQMFCDGEGCSYIRHGMPLHRDEGHLSEYGSAALQPYFTDWARRQVPRLIETGVDSRRICEGSATPCRSRVAELTLNAFGVDFTSVPRSVGLSLRCPRFFGYNTPSF